MTNLQDPLLLPEPEWGNFDALFKDMELTEVIFELRALAQVLLELNDPVILTDENGRLLYISKQAFTPPLQTSIFDLDRSQESAIKAVLEQLEESNGRIGLDLSIKGTQNEELSFDFSIIRIKPRDRVFLIWLCRDNSEHQPAPKKLEFGEFTSSLSHDLRSPLVSIRGYGQLLREEIYPSLSRVHQHYFDRLTDNIEIIDKMIRNLVEKFRINESDETVKSASLGQVVNE